MKEKLTMMMVGLFLSIGIVSAQTTKVEGVVISTEDDAPIVGASVIAKGTSIGTVTNMDGEFVMEVPSTATTLTVSYLGMRTQEVAIRPGMMEIALKPDLETLEEVVVTGYGTFKKSAYAGSASTVRTDNMQDVPAVSFQDMLQGSAAGVSVSSTSGQPGGSTTIRVRGLGSFNASSSPLYVIDGVPVISGDVSALDTNAGLDIMSTISNSDIESITVIKDAAAASLYGSRAANGVVLITTKKGKVGKPAISLKADWGWSDLAMQFHPIMDGQERRDFIYDALKNGQLRNQGATEEEAKAYADKYIDDYAPVPWCGFVDWTDVLQRKGNHSNYDFSLSGGTDRVNYYTSLSYLKQNGISINSGLERISARVNVEYKASKRFTVGANLLFAHTNQDVDSEGTSYTSLFYSSRFCVTPSDPVYNEDGTWNRSFIRNSDRNPLLSLTYDYKKETVNRFFNTIYGEYEFIDNLKLRSTLSYDYNTIRGHEWYDPRTSNGDDTNGDSYMRMYERMKLVWKTQLSYNINIAKYHNLDALIGYEIDDQRRDYITAEKTNFASSTKNDVSNGATLESAGGLSYRTRMVSYLGRVNYDYKEKYFVGASYRMDGSSRLAKGHRWGSFWSASAAWRVIEENFMEPVKDVLTDLKLRVSYGANGTLPTDYYGYMGLLGLTGEYMSDPALTLSQVANNDLSWEKNYNFNIGLDFQLWNILGITIEYYNRTTKDLLMDKDVSYTTGYSTYLMNIGKVRNQGVELEITSHNFNKRDFQWTTTFTLTHNANKILELDGVQDEIVSSPRIHKVGLPYYTYYLYEFAGIDPQTGEAQFYVNSVNPDGSYNKEVTKNLDEAFRIPYKHAEPVVSGGLGNTFHYKWFDLSFMITYQFGGYSYDNWAQKTENSGSDLEGNIPIYYRNAWKQPGDVTRYEIWVEDPEYSMASYANTRRLHSSDFIRLKNLTFGFTFPREWTRHIGIDNIRLYLSGANLLTWAAYDNYDPESAAMSGTSSWYTPPLKTITFGLNINF